MLAGYMAASIGLQAVSSLVGMSQQQAQAKAARQMQEYNNKLNNLMAAQTRNTIQNNLVISMDESAKLALDIQNSEAVAKAKAKAMAGATGTIGNSVSNSIMNIAQAYQKKEYARRVDVSNKFNNAIYADRGAQFQAQTHQDNSTYQSPGILDTLLPLVSKSLGAYAMYGQASVTDKGV